MTTPYAESLRGLLRLHELEVAGESESDQAEAVRDSLEGPWRLLTDTEKERITGLSEDLYRNLEAREIYPDPRVDQCRGTGLSPGVEV